MAVEIFGTFDPPRHVMTTKPPPLDADVLYAPLIPGTTGKPSKATVLTLLTEAFPDSAAAHQIYTQKVEHRPLSVVPATRQDARESRREARLAKLKKKRKPKPLSAKEKRELKVFEVAKDSVKYFLHHQRFGLTARYADFEKLNALWNHYISEILRDAGSNPSTTVAGPILLKADYHGALVTIEDCKSKSRVGIQGICIKETKNMFEIVTPTDALLKIPKEKTLFLVKARLAEGKEFEWRIWGDQFLVRSGERAGKKFGPKNIRGKALLEL